MARSRAASSEGPDNVGTRSVRSAANRRLMFGAFALAYAAFAFALGSIPLTAVSFAAFAGVWIYLGLSLRRSAREIAASNEAVALLLRSRPEDAEARIEALEAASPTPRVRRLIASNRAVIAEARGDLEAARRLLDEALALPLGFLGRAEAESFVALAMAFRALVRAELGDAAGARDDAARARAFAVASPSARAFASLAEAVALERTGDLRGLAELMTRHGRAMLEGLSVQHRARARALRRMALPSSGAVYRRGASVESSPAEEAEEATSGARGTEEPRRRRGAKARRGARSALREVAAAAETRREEEARGLRAARAKGLGRIALLLLCVFVVVVGYVLSRPPAPAPEAPLATLDPFLALVGAFGALRPIVATIRGELRRRALARRLAQAARDELGRPDAAETAYGELALDRDPFVAAGAACRLGAMAEGRGDFAGALARYDAALVRLATPELRALASDLRLPEIRAGRALALAATGRDVEARAELELLREENPRAAFLPLAELRVGLVLAARAGDFQGAASLAQNIPGAMPLPLRDDLLAQVVLVAGASSPSPSRVEWVWLELRLDPEAARWIDALGPGILERLPGALPRWIQTPEEPEQDEEQGRAAPGPRRAEEAEGGG